jgi:hypothetical protein
MNSWWISPVRIFLHYHEPMADNAQFLACMARLSQALTQLGDFPPEVLLGALGTQVGNGLRIMREEGVISAEVARETLAKIERAAFPP